MWQELPGATAKTQAVGVASVVIATENPRRAKLIICNAGVVDCYLARINGATLNSGILLLANGGTIIDEPDTLGRIYTGVWSAISSGAGTTLSISEE